MNDLLTTTDWTSPKRSIDHVIPPDSPGMEDAHFLNSDDLQPTSNLHPSSLGLYAVNTRKRRDDLVIAGSYEKAVTLGRGGSCTIKIGRRNRQISRCHVSIEFNKTTQQFELTVLGLNGACVDDIHYDQHAVVPLNDNSFVDVLGDQFFFRAPPYPINQTKKQKVDHITRELSPEIEVEEAPASPVAVVESKEEDEEYPIELVPEDALSPPIDPESLSPEPVVENEENKNILEEKDSNLVEDTTDYAEVIIDALVFSRTSSMPVSDICSRILKANPAYAEQPREVWMQRIRRVLKERPFFGEIQRKGKTADGSPTENLYYYNSELDPVEWRRATYTQVGRSARKCTLKDKQYFWKIPPKLGRHRSSYIPPSALELKKQKQKDIQNENDRP
ncbi:hypothetical protein EDC96DRAFT_451998 [Choanephora cucurbitarum]|nr:hypothetical protein EDC96DRAFT_451998 [Choanephora cucurbitarum]